MDIRRILCPVDFSEASRHALQVAVALASVNRACVTVLHVGRQLSLYPPLVVGIEPAIVPFPARCERAARVARFVEPFVDCRRPIDVIFDEGDVAQVIVATARRLRIDLIVMGTHGRGRLGRRLLGSVSSDVLETARAPVLVVGSECGPPRRARHGISPPA